MHTPEEIIQRLKDGNARFMADELEHKQQDQPRRGALTSGQDPWAIVVSCADSRVVPELAFDTGLGELFVLRVAGNVANTSTIASVEYAVAHLGTPVVVVMGHQSCGAVTAAMGGGDNGHNLNHLLAHITPAIATCGHEAPVDDVVRENARQVAADLTSRSTIIKGAVDGGNLTIVPAYYKLDDGEVVFL